MFKSYKKEVKGFAIAVVAMFISFAILTGYWGGDFIAGIVSAAIVSSVYMLLLGVRMVFFRLIDGSAYEEHVIGTLMRLTNAATIVSIICIVLIILTSLHLLW